MPVMVQIRNMPDAMHRVLKARAALEGMSLSDYLLREVGHVAERPSMTEMRARWEGVPDAELSEDPVDAIRAERERG